MCIYMYVYVYYECMHGVYMSAIVARARVYVVVYVWVCMYVYAYMRVCMYACVRVYVCV